MSGGGQNTVSQQTVPSWLQPYYTGALNQGQGLLDKGGPQYYGGNQVAPLSGMQSQGLQDISNVAGGPSPSQGAANANEFETSGALLNPSMNPYLQDTFRQAANVVQNQISSEFAGNGSNVMNSLPVQEDSLNNLATQLYGGAYQQGLQTMTQASALAPGIQQGQYLPGQELMQAGSAQQQQQQNEISAAMQKYNWNSQLPYNMLSWYSGLLGQNASPFGGSSSRATMNNDPLLMGAGGALAGGMAGGALAGTEAGSFLGPWGMAGGAALGGLLGLFGNQL